MAQLSTPLASNDQGAARSVYRAQFPDGLRFTPFDISGTRRRVWRIEGAAEVSTLECDPSGSLAIGYTRKSAESRELVIPLQLVA